MRGFGPAHVGANPVTEKVKKNTGVHARENAGRFVPQIAFLGGHNVSV